MTYMNQGYIEQNDVVLRYVHGTLTADELSEFEKYMLLNPEILEDIELTQAFKKGLELRASQGISSNSKKWSWVWPASGLVAGVCATWLFMGPLSSSPQSPLNLSSPDIVYIDTMRGAMDTADIDAEAFISSHNEQHLLVFDVSRFDQSSYQLSLEDQKGMSLQHWANITPNEKNELVIQTEIKAKTTDQYLLVLRGTEQNNILMKTRLTVE